LHTDHPCRRGSGQLSQQPGCRADRRVSRDGPDQRSSRCAT